VLQYVAKNAVRSAFRVLSPFKVKIRFRRGVKISAVKSQSIIFTFVFPKRTPRQHLARRFLSANGGQTAQSAFLYKLT